VPEGGVNPPTEHMRYPGTITVPDDVFEKVLESAARSFKLAGFRDIVFLGDHGGYQRDEKAVAARLDRALVTDVTAFKTAAGVTAFVRPMFQGKLTADVVPQGDRPHFVTVQVGAFHDRGNAERLRDRLSPSYSPIFIQQYDSPDGTFYRVRVGKISGEDSARDFGEQLRIKEGFAPLVIRLDEPAASGAH